MGKTLFCALLGLMFAVAMVGGHAFQHDALKARGLALGIVIGGTVLLRVLMGAVGRKQPAQRQQARRTQGHPRTGRRASADGYTNR